MGGGATVSEGSDAVSLIGEMPGGMDDLPTGPVEIMVLLDLTDGLSRDDRREAPSMMFLGSNSFISRDDIMTILPKGVARSRPKCGK